MSIALLGKVLCLTVVPLHFEKIQGTDLIIAAQTAIIKIYSEHFADLQDLMNFPGSYSEKFKPNSQRAARSRHWENHRRATRHGFPAFACAMIIH